MKWVVRSAERIDPKHVRVVVCTDRLELVQIVVRYGATNTEALGSVVDSALRSIPPTPKGRGQGDGRHLRGGPAG